MTQTKSWWLISDEDAKVIREGLEASTHDINDFNCPNDYPDFNKCSACEGDELRQKARYALDTGLHLTDTVPSDFREEGEGAASRVRI